MNYVVAPWWQTGWFIFSGASAAGTRFYFRRKDRTAAAYKNDANQLFYNNQPWPVAVDELRFLYGSASTTPATNDMLGNFAFRVQSSKYGNLWDEWALGSALCNAPPERFTPLVGRPSGRMLLPQPLEMSAEENFFIRAYPGLLQSATIEGFQVGIKGFDPFNESPVARVSDAQDITTASQNDFAITNDRDKASRSIRTEELTFSAHRYSATAPFPFIELDIQPPKGPRWTDDISTPLGLLYDQHRSPAIAGMGGGGIHIPGSPYVLNPGSTFLMEGQLIDAPVGSSGARYLACCLYGHQIVPEDHYR